MSEIEKEAPSFYAIIPANVRYDKNLVPNAKLLYGEITALCNKTGECRAGDTYFSKLYDVGKTAIQAWLKSLEQLGYIKRRVEYKEGTKEILNRYIRIMVYPIPDIGNTPIPDMCGDNITSSNNTINNTKDSNTFSIPTLQEIIDYCTKNKKNIDTAKFYNCYNDNGRTISGKPMKSRKMTIATWCKKSLDKNKEKVIYSSDEEEIFNNIDVQLDDLVLQRNNIDELIQCGKKVKGLPRVNLITKSLKDGRKQFIIGLGNIEGGLSSLLEIGLNNYIDDIEKRKCIPGKSYDEHRFSLEEFLLKDNGIIKFINK